MQPFSEIGSYYDLLYASKDYAGEVDYVDGLIVGALVVTGAVCAWQVR